MLELDEPIWDDFLKLCKGASRPYQNRSQIAYPCKSSVPAGTRRSMLALAIPTVLKCPRVLGRSCGPLRRDVGKTIGRIAVMCVRVRLD